MDGDIIRRFLRPLHSWLTGRLDRISLQLTQLNFDPGRDQILLSVRDAVSVAGVSVARLENAVAEVATAGLAAIRFRDAEILSAVRDLPAGSVVVVVGDGSSVELVSILRALELAPVVVDPRGLATLAGLPQPAAALVVALGEDLDEVWPSRTGRASADDLPDLVVVGISGAQEAEPAWLARVVAAVGLPTQVEGALAASSSVRALSAPRGDRSVLSARTA